MGTDVVTESDADFELSLEDEEPLQDVPEEALPLEDIKYASGNFDGDEEDEFDLVQRKEEISDYPDLDFPLLYYGRRSFLNRSVSS